MAQLIAGIVGVLVGFLVMIVPRLLAYIIGAWLIFWGILEIVDYATG